MPLYEIKRDIEACCVEAGMDYVSRLGNPVPITQRLSAFVKVLGADLKEGEKSEMWSKLLDVAPQKEVIRQAIQRQIMTNPDHAKEEYKIRSILSVFSMHSSMATELGELLKADGDSFEIELAKVKIMETLCDKAPSSNEKMQLKSKLTQFKERLAKGEAEYLLTEKLEDYLRLSAPQ